jgi:hypothetical protein
LRSLGPRLLEEIPPSEIQAVARLLEVDRVLPRGSDEHLRQILDVFGLKRLTTQVGLSLLEAIDGRFEESE